MCPENSEPKYARIHADLVRSVTARTREEDDIAFILKKLAESLTPQKFVKVMKTGKLPSGRIPLSARQKAIFQASTGWIKHLDKTRVVTIKGLGGYCQCTD